MIVVASIDGLGQEGSIGALALVLVMVAVLGRAILSFLPAGLPGSHALRDLPATWAASHLVGSTAWLALFAWAPGVDGRISDVTAFSKHSVLVGFGIAAVLAIVRAFTSPGTMVPRHEPALDRSDARARVLILAALATLAYAVVSSRGVPRVNGSDLVIVLGLKAAFGEIAFTLASASALAALVLVGYALERARALPWMRATAMLVFALVIALRGDHDWHGLGLASAVSFATGAAFTIPWLRRADKRALFLAVIAFAAAAPMSASGWPCAVAGLAWLVTGTAKQSRLFAASVALAFGAIAGVLTWSVSRGSGVWWFTSPLEVSPTSTDLAQAFTLLMFGVVFTARWFDTRDRKRRPPTTSGAPYAHEDTILLRMTTSSLFLGFIVKLQFNTPGDPLLPAMLVLAILVGTSLKRFSRETNWR